MRVPFNTPFILVLAVGTAWAVGRVTSIDGRIVLQDASGQRTELTETGHDSDPWLSPGGQTVVFLRHQAEDTSRTSVYEIDMPNRTPRLLYSGPAKYEGARVPISGDRSSTTRTTLSSSLRTSMPRRDP